MKYIYEVKTSIGFEDSCKLASSLLLIACLLIIPIDGKTS